LDSREIYEISVDLPAPPLDELYFRKAVSWCFVLFWETGPFIRFSGNLLRAHPEAHEKYVRAKQLVEYARTVHAHNLHSDREHDRQKFRAHQIWLIENGGEPLNWQNCNLALMSAVNEVLVYIEREWIRRCEDEIDRRELRHKYELEKRTFWEPHEFDPFVEIAAEETGLNGFDSTAFRKDGNRLQRWRKLVECFDTREAASVAIGRAIRTEIISVFGHAR
jgi:hypothetical protein